jgi:hypothetical protein
VGYAGCAVLVDGQLLFSDTEAHATLLLLNLFARQATAPLAEQVARAKAERAELRQLAGLEDAPVSASANFGHRPVPPSPAVPPRPRGDRRRSRDDGFGHLPAPDSISIV